MFVSGLLTPLFSDPVVAAEFADAQYIRYMLHVEAVLARVQARLGVIPPDAADPIARAAVALALDMAKLQASIDQGGVPTIGLVQQLRAAVGGAAASYVHWGTTSQDIMDTALVLQLRAALEHVETTLTRLIRKLATLADAHRATLMPGRTHAQQALPITFGFKVAGWLAPLARYAQRLDELRPRVLIVQFGGAVGTLASLGVDGVRVQAALAQELGLGVPLMPWHTQRDALLELANWLSMLSASLGKIGQDIILLAQTEVGEVRESDDEARGGSSTMPQKSNPITSELLVAAARMNASLLSALQQAAIHEHERATGGWQVEWLALPQMMILTAAALQKAVFLSENLVVNADAMRANVAASNGLMLAEAFELALAPFVGRGEAKQLVKAACAAAVAENRHLADVLQTMTDAPLDWDTLRDEAAYLGSANIFIDRVLSAAKR